MRSIEDHPGPQLAHADAHHGHYETPDFLDVIGEVTDILEEARVAYAFMGGMASTTHGRPRWTHDVDIFVKPQDALRVLDLLKASGFQTERTDEAWLYKGFKKNVMVDIIFKSRRNIYLDDEMFSRSVIGDWQGKKIRFLPPEDLLVIKAAVHDEVGPRHWHDALGIVKSASLDWEYLLKRARSSPRRVLALLCYAQSNDLLVPNRVIRRLFHDLYDS